MRQKRGALAAARLPWEWSNRMAVAPLGDTNAVPLSAPACILNGSWNSPAKR